MPEDDKLFFILFLAIFVWAVDADISIAETLLWRPGESDRGLGFGWSHAERHRDGAFRWIEHMEADIWTEQVHLPGDLQFRMEAAVAHLSWRRQRVGLFINNRLIHEWVSPDDHLFHEYAYMVPSDVWRIGRNRITLRAAYRTRIGRDRRYLTLAVRELAFISGDEQDDNANH